MRAAVFAVAVSLPTSVVGAAQRADGGGSAANTPVAQNTDYRLAPGDKLRIEVYKDPLSQSLQIRPDGKVTLPLVGDMRQVDSRRWSCAIESRHS